MSALPGGSADKAGNQYEHWWTALRIADVLDGTASTIRLEPPGALGTGTEFTVEQGGVTWAEQAKDAPSGGKWTLTRLIGQDVLTAAKDHVEHGRRFRFVGSTSSPLAELCARASTAQDFAELQEQLNGEQKADLQKVADHWVVTPEKARDLLRKIDVVHHSNDSMRQLVRTRYQLLFVDDPEVVIGTLREHYESHLQEALTGPAIWAHMESAGLRRRLIVGDQSIVERLHKTVVRQQSRVDSAAPDIPLVPRSDVAALVDRLQEPACEQVIVLDGRAGYGKSTVVAQVAAELERVGWFVAVARMDSVAIATNTSDKLGESIGLSETPVVLLAGVADGQPALLIVDQLDAVSSYSGRMADNFESVAEALRELDGIKNVKALLVVRTVDLEADSRLRRLVARTSDTGRHTLGLLPLDEVKRALSADGATVPADETTLELLRTPLHLAVFSHLTDDGQGRDYETLQGLYDQYTIEMRGRVAERIGPVDWQEITGSMVTYMSDHEVLVAPSSVLDAVQPAHVHALVSEAVLASDGSAYAFFHESYFDYLFARTFVGSGRDLSEFLASSGQVLFRRAQTRQVLEHLAATDPKEFRATVVALLSSAQIRYHLKAVVVDVLGPHRATTEDWRAFEQLAFDDVPVSNRIRGLLGGETWFDAADQLGRWEQWLSDSEQANLVFRELAVAARVRPQRVADLIRPHVGESDLWRNRIRALVEWSLNPGLTDLVVELLEAGELDEAQGRVAVNSDFWSLVYHLHTASPTDAIRMTGAYLRRAVSRAEAEGSHDPFEAGILPDHSQGDGVLDEMRQADPQSIVAELLPFVVTVAMANQFDRDHLLPAGRRWAYRHIDSEFTVDDSIFNTVDAALRDLAERDPVLVEQHLDLLRDAESDELRFLACRTLTVCGPADTAIEWLVEDPRNLSLGWSDSPRWASCELIAAWSPSCSEQLFGALEAVVLEYQNPYESRQSLGNGQYELLSALDGARLSDQGRRKLGELTRRFGERIPRGPSPVEAYVVGPPIGDEASTKMSDDDWIRALAKHNSDELRWDDDIRVGGAHELAGVLGRRTAEDPERFAQLGLRLDNTIPASALEQIIWNLPATIDPELLADVCEHARLLHGEAAGRSTCSTISKVDTPTARLAELVASCAKDTDPDRELAHTPAGNDGQHYFGGDLFSAGLNSTRGEAALAAAHILFATDEFTDILRPTVRALANDPTLAVRTCAAEAVGAMLNRDAALGLDLGEGLFSSSIEVLDAQTTERLLVYLVRRAPDRFAATLVDGLAADESTATRAGVVWAVSLLNDGLAPGLPAQVRDLSPGARRGAARVFEVNVADAQPQLIELFDDDDDEVRRHASIAMRNLDGLEVAEVETFVRSFMNSRSFDEHFELLLDALDAMAMTLPDVAIEVCERTIDVAGSDLADIRTSAAAAGSQVTSIVLRLYRQAGPALRSRCLDLIDRLTEVAVNGVDQALDGER